jgi:ribosomal protein S18 acetylase RimI-like enzyme
MTVPLRQLKLPWPFGPRNEAAAPAAPAPAIAPLTPALARTLRLPWTSRFTPDSLTRQVAQAPGWSWAIPATGEYLVAEGWRRRGDVALLLEVGARHHRAALVTQAAAQLQAAGVGALLVSDDEWGPNSRAYGQLGFARLERIVYYQLSPLRLPLTLRRPLPTLAFSAVGPEPLATAVQVDHAAFPWLWWNSSAEFAHYLRTPGVQVVLGRDGGQPVGYAGFTIAGNWGHLDRLAVVASAQGRGWGAALLAHALILMAQSGVTRVTLSTQLTNIQSQRLYEGFGFRRTHDAHNIYGKWLGEARAIV